MAEEISGGFGSAAFGAFAFGEGSPFTFIGNWEPLVGGFISRLDVVSFDVTNDEWRIVDTDIRTYYTDGAVETVWMGSEFGALYRRGSARLPIAGGYRYIIRRTGGWLSPNFRIRVTATDLAGESVSGQSS